MNRNQFISYIHHPDKLSGNDSVLLAELLKNFPYFQTAHLLYTKSLHNQHSIHYNNQLKITAAYATDRQVLHAIITKQPEPETVKVVEKHVEEVVLEKQVSTITTIEIEQPIQQEEVIETITIEETIEIVEEIAIDEKEEILEINVIEKELEKEYLLQAAIASVEIEVAMESFVEKETLPEVVDIVVNEEEKNKEEELITVQSNFVLNTVGLQAKSIESTEIVDKDIDEHKSHSFTEWLQLSSSRKIITTQPEFKTKDIQEVEPIGKQSSNEIIEKFIREEPRISKPKAEFYNPVSMAKQSVADDITFVTETLAKILAMQGNYTKALDAYENLRLKYPEKRLYFASQIKKLRKLINEQNNK